MCTTIQAFLPIHALFSAPVASQLHIDVGRFSKETVLNKRTLTAAGLYKGKDGRRGRQEARWEESVSIYGRSCLQSHISSLQT